MNSKKFYKIIFKSILCIFLLTPSMVQSSDWAATISRLKSLPMGFVVVCGDGDLRIKGSPGQGSFVINKSQVCKKSSDNYLICIAGAGGAEDDGRPVPDCRDLDGDFT